MGTLKGKTTPRVYTLPKVKGKRGPCGCGCALTEETSGGFEVIAFAESVNIKLMPWQRWLLIHALELNPDGTFRFKEILLEVARQNGKTTLLEILIAYWVEQGLKVLSTSASLEVSDEQWDNVLDLFESDPDRFGKPHVVRQNGKKAITLHTKGRYKIAGATRKGGRGSAGVHRVVEDELREHLDWLAHASATNTTIARPDSQVWMLTNAGDDRSVVWQHYHALGLSDEMDNLGFFTWSAEDDCEITDRTQWAQANPALGYTITEQVLESKLTAPASIFRTENLCQGVPALREAITATAWSHCLDPGDLSAYRRNVALCVDISPDLRHCTLVAAAVLPDDRVRIDAVAAWDTTAQLRKDLPDLIKKIRPRVFGYFQSGPAAALATELNQVRGIKPLTATNASQACQGLAELIQAGRIAQNGDELLASHLLAAKKRKTGEGWVFDRRDGGQVDAAFASAGAVHLARSLPKRTNGLTLITSKPIPISQ